MAETKAPAALAKNARAHVIYPWTAQRGADPVTVVTRGEGVYFYDESGVRYLDFSSQLFNVNLGYGNRQIIKAIKQQADELTYIGPNFATPAKLRLGELVAEVTPGDLAKAVFTNSGSEANEVAFQVARMVTGRQKILAKYRSYHGTTTATLSVGGDPRRLRVEPGAPGTVRFFDPYCYRCDYGMTFPECNLHCLHKVEDLIQMEGPQTIAAVVVEPVAGSSGGFVPPGDWMPELRELCDRYGILLICDEVINGFGRTGEWFAVDHWGVVPDILVVAKGITSGYVPLGAAILRRSLADHFEEHLYPVGQTYSGHPLAMAAGIATIKEYRNGDVIAHAARMGECLMRELEALKAKHPCVGDVRGLGLLCTVELVRDRGTRASLVPLPDSEIGGSAWSKRILGELKARGVHTSMRWGNLFISPPLIITEAELREGLDALDDVLSLVDGEI
jgi:taurine--2-oxoglutarate transaminase